MVLFESNKRKTYLSPTIERYFGLQSLNLGPTPIQPHRFVTGMNQEAKAIKILTYLSAQRAFSFRLC